jgi:hypothetical protein
MIHHQIIAGFNLNLATGDDEEPQDITAERFEDFKGFIYCDKTEKSESLYAQ